MQTVYIMIGIPGAGKTTFAKTRLSHAVYLGTDAIREELFGKELTLRGHKQVHAIMHERMLKLLSEGHDVVIDCTNVTRKRRKKLLDIIPPEHRVIAMYMDTSFFRAVCNNRKRKRHVPLIGILSMYRGLSVPQMEEGFSEIYRIRTEYRPQSRETRLFVERI